MNAASVFSLQARWVFPVAAPPIAGGVVSVRQGRIVEVGCKPTGPPPHDLGDAAILPGLVNAHTHLEFSDLRRPLGEEGMTFPAWIREVIAWRRQRDASAGAGHAQRAGAVELGLRESAASGVATLGEIATPGWPAEPLAAARQQVTVFQELLGLAPDRQAPLLELAQKHIAAGQQNQTWRPGLSPHAPYTAPLELVAAAAELSRQARVPLAMHLAESREELELLRSGTGPFFDFLAELSPQMPELVPRGVRPRDYLVRLAGAHRALAIHGNYLDEAEVAVLADHAATMAVVYCPRTHAYFRHDRYPLERLLAGGVTVALGTDSRASNPDLSLWEEMRFVARHHSGVSPATVLCLGTQAGAQALGLADVCGTLTAGQRADLTIVQLSPRSAADPHDLLFDDNCRVVASYAVGCRVL